MRKALPVLAVFGALIGAQYARAADNQNDSLASCSEQLAYLTAAMIASYDIAGDRYNPDDELDKEFGAGPVILALISDRKSLDDLADQLERKATVTVPEKYKTDTRAFAQNGLVYLKKREQRIRSQMHGAKDLSWDRLICAMRNERRRDVRIIAAGFNTSQKFHDYKIGCMLPENGNAPSLCALD